MATNHIQPLTEDELAALLDGTASEALRRRVENNVDYQEQVEDARFETQLGNILYRFDCPTTEELSGYYLNMMDPVGQQNVVRHLDICETCQMEIAALANFLDGHEGQKIDTGTFVPVRPQYTVATIYTQQAQTRGSVRGAVRGPLKTVTAEADDLHIALTVSEDKVGVQLEGQLAPSTDSVVDWEAAIVELRLKGDRKPHVTTIDDAWQFRFQQIETAAVNIRLIATEGQIVLIENIELTEN